MFDQHPAVAWDCLGNEFLVLGSLQPFWVQDPVGLPDDLWYFEMVVKDPAGRSKKTIWSDRLADVLSETAGAKAATTTRHRCSAAGRPASDDPTRCTPAHSLSSGLDLALIHAYPEADAPAVFGVPRCLVTSARRWRWGCRAS
jgi:hypothetical protein